MPSAPITVDHQGNPRSTLEPDTSNPYQKIAADIRGAISAGFLPPGSTLPAVTELAARYHVSTGTAHRATGQDAQVVELVDALVALCERRGLHRKVIAERMGVHNSTVYNFDAHRFEPTFSMLLRYAEASGACVDSTVITPEGVAAPETATPAGESTRLAQVQAALASVRKAQRRTFEQVAQAMDRSAGMMLKMESQENLQVDRAAVCRGARCSSGLLGPSRAR